MSIRSSVYVYGKLYLLCTFHFYMRLSIYCSNYCTNILFVSQATKGKRASLLMDIVILVTRLRYGVFLKIYGTHRADISFTLNSIEHSQSELLFYQYSSVT